MWMCETEVAMSFLTLALDTTIAVWGNIEDEIVILLSCWERSESFFTLLAKLNKNRSWKMSIILEPRLSSESRVENNEKIPCSLLYKFTRCSLIEFFWRSVSVLIEWGEGLVYIFGASSMRVLMRWFFERAAEQS